MKRSQPISPNTNTGQRLKRLDRARKPFLRTDLKPGEEMQGLEVLMDEHEFSRITGRSVGTVRRDRLLRQGCPYVKLHGLVRYRPSDVRRFIESNLRFGSNEEAQ